MSSEKPNFLSQPVVKNIFMFRNGDPYYQARRIVINQKRVSNFETLLREVTGGIQAPFGAVRNIYTPRGGHKVDCMESLQSGEQYVAAGRERFKRLDYQQISLRRKRMVQSLPAQVKPPPTNRIIVSARFLKPIKEPCTIFVVANGDVLNPAMRLLIHQRMLGQFDRILEMITEKMGLKVLGGVRSLYTYEGHQMTDGNQLESGQLYVAVGRERFKKLPYSDLLFTKPRGTRRVNGMKAYSLPPIYRFSKQNGNSKSMLQCSDSGDGDSKASPPAYSGNSKEHLSSIVREISQARLISLRKKRSGQSMTLGISDNDDLESKANDGNTEDKTPQEQPAEEKPADDDTKATEEDGGKAGEKEEAAVEGAAVDETSTSKEEQKESQESEGEKEEEEEKKESDEQKAEKEGEEEKKESDEQKAEEEGEEEKKESDEQKAEEEGEEEKKESDEQKAEEEGEEEKKESEEQKAEKEGEEEKKESDEQKAEKEGEPSAGSEEKEEEVEEEVKEEVRGEEQGSGDKTQDSRGKEDGSHTSSEGEKDEQGKNTEEEKPDNDSGKGEKSSKDQVNDVDTEEKWKEPEKSDDPGKSQSDHETKGNDNDRSSSSNSNQEEDVSKTKEGATTESGERESKVNGEVSGEDDGVGSEAELDTQEKTPAVHKDATENGENGEDGGDEDNRDKSRKEKD